MIEIKPPNFKELSARLKEYDKETKKAFYRAQNKGIRKFRTEEAKEVRKVYTKVKKSAITKATSLKFANMSNLNAEVKISGALLPIQDSLLRTKKQTKKGIIKVNIKNNATKQLRGKGNKPFIMVVNGKPIAVQRKGKDRYPIKQMKTLSIPQMLNNIKVNEPLIKITQETIDAEFIRLFNLKGEDF